MDNAKRDAVAVEVKSRVLAACLKQSKLPGGLPLDVLVNETLYLERTRLRAHPHASNRSQDAAFWDQIKTELATAGEGTLRGLLAEIVGRYTDEVTGNFNPWVYRATTKVLPRALPMLLNGLSPQRLIRRKSLPTIQDNIRVQGKVDALRRCHKRGTVIVAPTHVSNLDSIIMGWAIFALGLPPVTYGAGLNLFSNPVFGYFMNNLGAYRVDRLKTAPIYKDVLKEYATVSLEFGQSQLFFPAGTRVRSGEVDHKLKLGLLSSGLRAYINNLQRGRARERVYIVPATINYHLVLEASTLIDDHLKAVGRSRYIINDDESSRPRQVVRFMRDLANLDSRITITFGEPLDPFGNRVDEDGESVDARGRQVDIERYVLGRDGKPAHLPQRDHVYTAQAGAAVAKAYRRQNVVLSTNLVAYALYENLRAAHPDMDLFRLLRTAGDGAGVEFGALAEAVRRLLTVVNTKADAGELRVEEVVASRDPSRVIRDALRLFGSYHTHPVMVRHGDRVFSEDMNLLYYYRNRLTRHGLEGALTSAEEAES